eukprot:8809049-Pyramimonas_sp.AAC.2
MLQTRIRALVDADEDPGLNGWQGFDAIRYLSGVKRYHISDFEGLLEAEDLSGLLPHLNDFPYDGGHESMRNATESMRAAFGEHLKGMPLSANRVDRRPLVAVRLVRHAACRFARSVGMSFRILGVHEGERAVWK